MMDKHKFISSTYALDEKYSSNFAAAVTVTRYYYIKIGFRLKVRKNDNGIF